jgi:phosphopantothenoylcysteine decarboxylase/phosphopantothenate--cysteine ligase
MPGTNVLLLLTGGIAAYKSCFLTRLLVQAGFSVRVGMTDAACRFVGPVTLRALSGHGVATDLWGEGDTDPLDHVDLAQWADLTVVAPATANLLGKAANGIADDIVTTLLLANEAPLLLAPAMNDAMWRHPAVKQNLETMKSRGAVIVGPGSGYLACGSHAEGRMAEPQDIFQAVLQMADELPARAEAAETGTGPLQGCRMVITAGPTHEAIDAIRYISNRSTGAMGFALAGQAAAMGADVTLIHGPVASPAPTGVGKVVAVESAAQMAEAVSRSITEADVLIMSAAVADFAPLNAAEGKTKKESLGTSWQLDLTRTVDILAEVVDRGRHPDLKVVGFALETENLLEHAIAKLKTKGMDFIVANQHSTEDAAFGDGRHRVHLLDEGGVIWESGESDKREIAKELLERLTPRLMGKE